MNSSCGCCKVDAVVTLDSKGQIVLPKDLRERAGLKPNDKIALIASEKDEKVCCIMLIKVEALGQAVNKTLGPLLKGVI